MVEYNAPLQDMHFVLHDVWNAGKVWSQLPEYGEITADLANAVLEEAAKMSASLLAPLNRSGDEAGVVWDDGIVTTPEGFPQAWKTYAEAGWVGLSGNPEYNGQGMPKMLMVSFEEMLHAANTSFCVYSILTTGAALAIEAHAADELKNLYLPKLYSGEWTGVMALTESHAGTDLGAMRTRAEPQDDGSYKVSGTKIFITGGDNDLADNIVHLVLAKLPGAPASSKGISLFLVPKYLPDANGVIGERNSVHCGSVEHKMGIHASATCVMNYDGATGFMVGQPNKGLAAMFTMMNYERLSMGMQGVGCSELALQKSMAYANDRLQGRAADGATQPDSYADPIVVHADVRRMLLTQRAYTEAGRAFTSFVGMQLDISKYGKGNDAETAEALVALLTPVAKAFVTDRGLESCIAGQQVFGGHGYIREWGMEQLVRDVRIAQIYEGTNGVQALDLAGRKIVRSGGKLLDVYSAAMRAEVAELESSNSEFAAELARAVDELDSLTGYLLESSKSDPDAVGAASVDYMNAFGYVSYAFMWARMARVATAKAAQQDATGEFLAAKLATARFYFQRLLPLLYAYSASVRAGSASLMDASARLEQQ